MITLSCGVALWEGVRARYEGRPIRLGLEVVKAIAIKLGVDRPVIPCFTVAGTNGKGSTCAMLEAVLTAAGFHVGCYTSPHLVSFHERVSIDGQSVTDGELDIAFAAVEKADQRDELTAFEVDTLAALLVFKMRKLDALVLEVGLGGRLDAVNVVDADCAIITSIALDHMEWLGTDRESIGREKAGIMRQGRPVIVSDPMPPHSILECADAIGADLWSFGRDFNCTGDRQHWRWSGRGRSYNALGFPALRGVNQLANASGVLAALEAMHLRLPVPAQAVRNGLALVELPGRFQVVPGQPTLVLDVAHNPHAAAVLAQNLDQMGFFPRTHAVLGAMADKDLAGLVAPLLPLVDVWHLCDLPTPRAASAETLRSALDAARAARPAGLAPLPASVVHCSNDPVLALETALKGADPTDRIVVFGSFHTVGGVLQHGLPRLGAAHIG